MGNIVIVLHCDVAMTETCAQYNLAMPSRHSRILVGVTGNHDDE